MLERFEKVIDNTIVSVTDGDESPNSFQVQETTVSGGSGGGTVIGISYRSQMAMSCQTAFRSRSRIGHRWRCVTKQLLGRGRVSVTVGDALPNSFQVEVVVGRFRMEDLKPHPHAFLI